MVLTNVFISYFGKTEKKDKKRKNTKKNTNKIPVLGEIAAGTPFEAIQNEISRITLPEELSKNGEHFGLKISDFFCEKSTKINDN